MAGLLISIWRIAYCYSSLIVPFLKKLSFSLKIFHQKLLAEIFLHFFMRNTRYFSPEMKFLFVSKITFNFCFVTRRISVYKTIFVYLFTKYIKSSFSDFIHFYINQLITNCQSKSPASLWSLTRKLFLIVHDGKMSMHWDWLYQKMNGLN